MRPLAPGFMVWLAGLLLGSVTPGPAPRVPASIDFVYPKDAVDADGQPMPSTYHMLAADFHVHSFPGDGALWPWDIAAEARRRGLNVVALTNHNQTLPWRLAAAARSWMPSDVLIVRGEEVTSPDFHLVAIGIDRRIAWARSPRTVIDAVHAAGGAAIAAHPNRRFGQAYDTEAFRRLDGTEVAHPVSVGDISGREVEAFYAKARAQQPSIAAIGSSDFHREAPIGLDRTYLFATARSEAGVVDAVRHGRTAACDPRGRVIGAEPWASLARPSCEATMARAGLSSARGGGALNAFAVACALVGLASMVLSRSARG